MKQEPAAMPVLVEEFTGIHCGYCPQAHAIAKAMLLAQPQAVAVIAYHAGYYAVPNFDQPDFRTDDIKVDKTSGISAAAVPQNGAAEYYTLSGVRVQNPTTGLYIVRLGGIATKKFIR